MTTNQTLAIPNATQRVLLEQAAEAAAINLNWSSDRGFGEYGTFARWNALESDGDAMAIASKLLMSIQLDHNGARAWIGEHVVEIKVPGNPYANLRLAIVRLAAQMIDPTA